MSFGDGPQSFGGGFQSFSGPQIFGQGPSSLGCGFQTFGSGPQSLGSGVRSREGGAVRTGGAPSGRRCFQGAFGSSSPGPASLPAWAAPQQAPASRRSSLLGSRSGQPSPDSGLCTPSPARSGASSSASSCRGSQGQLDWGRLVERVFMGEIKKMVMGN